MRGMLGNPCPDPQGSVISANDESRDGADAVNHSSICLASASQISPSELASITSLQYISYIQRPSTDLGQSTKNT